MGSNRAMQMPRLCAVILAVAALGGRAAVVLRRADAGIFPVVSAARVNLIGEKIRLFAPALINHNSVVLQKESTATRLADLKGKRIGTLDRISMTYTSLATVAKMQGLDLEQ